MYFVMLRDPDGDPIILNYEESGTVRLFNTEQEAVDVLDAYVHCPYGYKIYEWD